MKTKKTEFLKTVRRLAPRDPLILQAARRVPAAGIASLPALAAVHFVVGFYHLTGGRAH